MCRCHVTNEPPIMGDWWRPDLDDEPSFRVSAVAHVGVDPILCRAVRVPGGWVERGVKVDFHDGPVLPWSQVGLCWAKNPHPVVQVEP